MRKSGFEMTCLLLSFLVPACVPVADSEGEAGGDEEVAEAGQAVVASGLTAEVSTLSALATKEHCLVPQSVYDVVGVGNQVRLERTVGSVTHLSLCTVKGKSPSPSTKLLMRQTGLDERLGAAGSASISGVKLSTLGNFLSVTTLAPTVRATYDDDPVEGLSQDIREFSTRPFMSHVVYMAPHGRIEAKTAEQVDHLKGLPGFQAYWAVGLHTTAGTIAKHLHITSNDISKVSFPGLATFVNNPMTYAVSFHGFDDDPDRVRDDDGDGIKNDDDFPFPEDVLVGGNEDLSFRRGVAELIAEALEGTGFTARHDLSPAMYSPYRGAHDQNVVNRAALPDNGLQLEQSLSLRRHPTAPLLVAEAVKTIYNCLADVSDEYRSGTGTLESAGTSYLDTRVCPRFIAQFNLPSNIGPVAVTGGKPAGCSPGRVRVDVYTLDSDGSWTRVGGGFRTYAEGCVATDEPGFAVPSIPTPSNVRVVVRSLTAAGEPDVAAATVQ